MEVADRLCDMIVQRRVVRLFSARDPEGQSRLVEPHAVYIGSNDRGFVDFWQRGGWSWSQEPPGWRRLALTDIIDVEGLDQTFEPRSDYRPDNRRWYRAFVCAVTRVEATESEVSPPSG